MSRSALETVQIQREYIRRMEREIEKLESNEERLKASLSAEKEKVSKLSSALRFYTPGFQWFPAIQSNGRLQAPVLDDRGRRAQETLDNLWLT